MSDASSYRRQIVRANRRTRSLASSPPSSAGMGRTWRFSLKRQLVSLTAGCANRGDDDVSTNHRGSRSIPAVLPGCFYDHDPGGQGHLGRWTQTSHSDGKASEFVEEDRRCRLPVGLSTDEQIAAQLGSIERNDGSGRRLLQEHVDRCTVEAWRNLNSFRIEEGSEGLFTAPLDRRFVALDERV